MDVGGFAVGVDRLKRSPPRMPRKTAFPETLARGAGRATMEPLETYWKGVRHVDLAAIA